MPSIPAYSICITSFNTVKTVRKSLISILGQIDDLFEVIVVDNNSQDGTIDILKEYEKSGKIKLIIRACSRGKGRQIAVDQSKGDYLIVNVDLDDVYKPVLKVVTDVYEKYFEGEFLLMHGYGICPRRLAVEAGGYRDLQYAEDFDFYSRCARIAKFNYLDFTTQLAVKPHGTGSIRHRVAYKFYRARDLFSLGLNPLSNLGQRSAILNLPIVVVGYFACLFRTKYNNSDLKGFNVRRYLTETPTELKYQDHNESKVARI